MSIDIDGFERFLETRKLDQKAIESAVNMLQDFESFLKDKKGKGVESATRQDFHEYSGHLIGAARNTSDNYLSILRYAYFKRFNELFVAVMEVLDGSEVIENLSKRLIDEYNQELRDYVFKGIDIPPLGISPKEKPEYTRRLITRLEEKIGTEACAQFLNRGLRDRYEESRKPDREKFLKAKSIDEFLEQKHKGLVTELETCFKNGRLFFTQEITREVVEYVASDPFIETGVREGDKIIIIKIPYMAKEYLAEKDEQKKRRYYCHCPWVKDALRESAKTISPVFCNCSAGFYRTYWEIVFEQSVQVDVLESLLKGDSICKFAVYIPEGVR